MRKYFCQRIIFALLFILLNTGQAKATSILQLSVEQVCQRAELIFEGRVVSRETHLSPTNGYPFTYITFKIIDIIKGSYNETTIELAFMGGRKGDYVMNVRGMRMPELEEHGIYFVESTNNEQVHPLIGWDQGHYLVLPAPASGKGVVVPVKKDLSAMTVAPTLSEFKQTMSELIKRAR